MAIEPVTWEKIATDWQRIAEDWRSLYLDSAATCRSLLRYESALCIIAVLAFVLGLLIGTGGF